MFGLDTTHLVVLAVGVAITLVYAKWGKKSPGPDGIPNTPDDEMIIPGRPVLTMLLALIHKGIDGQVVQPSPNSPLDLQAELMILLHKLQSQTNDIPPAQAPVVQSPKT